MTSSTCKTRRP